MAVEALWFRNYRSLRESFLELGQITVLVGANGCGKTNFYRAVKLLTEAARGRLGQALGEEGGMPSALWAGPKPSPVRLQLGFRADPFSFEISCGLPTPSASNFVLDPVVKEEWVWVGNPRRRANTLIERGNAVAWVTDRDGNRVRYQAPLGDSESMLSQVREPELYPELYTLRDQLESWRYYHHFPTEMGAVTRQEPSLRRTPVLADDGRDVLNALLTIAEMGNKAALDVALERVFPAGVRLGPADSDPKRRVQLHAKGGQRDFDIQDISDGSLRYLCLIAALLSPTPPEFLVLNEPETSLHPQLLPPLAELIVAASRQSQILLTTHSTELARELLRQQPRDSPGGTKVVQLRMQGIETRFEDIEPDSTYFDGAPLQ